MATREWDRVQAIFQEVSELDSTHREQRLQALCGDRADVREEVLSLLHYHDESKSFLESSRGEEALAVIGSKEAVRIPECEGPYEVKKLIGWGGMGSVYLAEQTRPVRRSVALKVVNSGMNRDEFLGRFRYELQVLAMVNHPNIAHVLDAGKTVDGRPFFTMEYVPGRNILGYADNEKLTIPERLALFGQACDGVAHAHARGIIHRDIKPSNILVTNIDGIAVPKIIDFGIAKVLDQPGEEHLTLYGQIFGTPAYMSPEALEGDGIDTGVDIYALGIVLYELVTGLLPFEEDTYQSGSVLSVLNKLSKEEIPLAGRRVLANPDAANTRGTDQRSLVRSLRGDLENIIAKALARDRSRRYPTVKAFSDDIYRYLSGYPVRASSKGNLYYFRRFAHRFRKQLSVVAASFTVLLVVGLFFLRDYQQAKKIEIEAMRSAMALEVTFELIEEHNPFIPGKLDPVAFVNDVLARLRDIDAKALPPERRGVIYGSLGAILRAHNKPERERALLVFEEARRLLEQGGVSHLDSDWLWVTNLYTKTLVALNEYDRAEGILETMIRDLREIGPPRDLLKDYCEALHGLAWLRIRQGRNEEADGVFVELIPLQTSILDRHDPDRIGTITSYGQNYLESDRLEEGIRQLETARDLWQETDPEHPSALRNLGLLANAYFKQNRKELAVFLAERVFDGYQRELGEDHLRTMGAKSKLLVYKREADMMSEDEELKSIEEVLAERLDRFGPEDRRTLLAMNSLANHLMKNGELDEAEKIKKQELAIWRETGQSADDLALQGTITLGEIYEARGEYERAKDLFDGIATKTRDDETRQPTHYLALGFLGGALAASETGRDESAEAFLRQSYENLLVLNPRYAEVIKSKLVDFLVKRGRDEDIEHLE